MNKTIIIVIIAVIIIGGYFVFAGKYNTSTPTSDPALPEVTEQKDALEANVPAQGETDIEETIVIDEPSVTEVLEITIIGTEFAFSPSSITAQAGQQVIINFKNQGNAPHDLVIEGLGVRTAIIGGKQTDTIEFIAPASGSYTFFCSVGSHRSIGMEGSLNIE